MRERLYQMDQVYDADLRDQVLYGRVRPKLFTSEPSAVTFAYTHFSSIWLVISSWRYKLLAYFGLIAMALVVLPGPTLILMVFLAAPYMVFLAGTRPGGILPSLRRRARRQVQWTSGFQSSKVPLGFERSCQTCSS